jgi:23S rRNA pseudouridine2457 synthase
MVVPLAMEGGEICTGQIILQPISLKSDRLLARQKMLIRFNKPYGVICQFSPSADKPTLKDFIALPNVYPAGRLDTDSEGLLLLTDEGRLQARIADPQHKLPKTYWVEVEGAPTGTDLRPLREGINLGDFTTQPAMAKLLPTPLALWPRVPPVRFRKLIPTCWLEITIAEGKNRQIRRMTAKIGLPTLRLIRVGIGDWTLDGLLPGEWREVQSGSTKSGK